jgi:hypothetical protein
MTKFPRKIVREPAVKGGDVVPIRQGNAVQLSLFDFTPVYRLVCLPMADLHGMTFARLFGSIRPTVVVDVRNHPYFDLTALNRSIAFEIFESASARYLHLPLDLRRPADQSARWRLRQNTNSVLSSLLDTTLCTGGHNYAFLVHQLSEIEVLKQAIRSSEQECSFKWQVELPEASTELR